MRVSGGPYLWLALLLVATLLVPGVFLASCQPAEETEAIAEAQPMCNLPIPEAEPMYTSENDTVTVKEPGIPPIDAAVPEHIETATFSLG